MSFSFFKPTRPRTTCEIIKTIRDRLLTLDSKTGPEALEEVDKNFLVLRQKLLGDGEVEPAAEELLQLSLDICKEDVISLFVHKLPILGWDARKNLTHCWCILLKQKNGSGYCCVEYIENHLDLLDLLVAGYDCRGIALNCGNMLRECIKHPTLAKYILESTSFDLFFKYVELPNFDIASDAFATFKDLLTKHEIVASEFLNTHYERFFLLYERLMTSTNYVTRRQSVKLLSDFLLEPPNSRVMKRYILEVQYLNVIMGLLKDSSKNIQISAFHIFKAFVANPNKSHEVIVILAKNHEGLVTVLENLPVSQDDEQLEEERDLIIEEISRVSRLPNICY